MKAKIKIEKKSGDGSRVFIEAECDNITEMEEVTKRYVQRPRIFGIF